MEQRWPRRLCEAWHRHPWQSSAASGVGQGALGRGMLPGLDRGVEAEALGSPSTDTASLLAGVPRSVLWARTRGQLSPLNAVILIYLLL